MASYDHRMLSAIWMNQLLITILGENNRECLSDAICMFSIGQQNFTCKVSYALNENSVSNLIAQYVRSVSFQELLKTSRITLYAVLEMRCADFRIRIRMVKRRNDNRSPGPVIRELVRSSHQRSELSNTILCIFSR